MVVAASVKGGLLWRCPSSPSGASYVAVDADWCGSSTTWLDHMTWHDLLSFDSRRHRLRATTECASNVPHGFKDECEREYTATYRERAKVSGKIARDNYDQHTLPICKSIENEIAQYMNKQFVQQKITRRFSINRNARLCLPLACLMPFTLRSAATFFHLESQIVWTSQDDTQTTKPINK